jgi:NhaP-type Na+/H+ or K+/H+ antiporter
MKNKGLIIRVLLTFALTFLTTVVVTLFWNLLIEKSGAIVDWKTSFLFAIIIGLVIPIVKSTDGTK